MDTDTGDWRDCERRAVECRLRAWQRVSAAGIRTFQGGPSPLAPGAICGKVRIAPAQQWRKKHQRSAERRSINQLRHAQRPLSDSLHLGLRGHLGVSWGSAPSSHLGLSLRRPRRRCSAPAPNSEPCDEVCELKPHFSALVAEAAELQGSSRQRAGSDTSSTSSTNRRSLCDVLALKGFVPDLLLLHGTAPSTHLPLRWDP